MPRFASLPALALVLGALACGQPSSPKPGSGSSATPTPPAGQGSRVAPRAAEEECNEGECGPQMGMPNRQCPDGSMAGPTGRCLRHSDGRCGWEIRQCP